MKELQAMPRNAQKELVIKFFTIVLGGVGSFVLMFSVAMLAFFMPAYYGGQGGGGFNMEGSGVETGGWWNLNQMIVSQPPVRTTFLLAGIDNEDHGADVIILGAFNRLTGYIDLINIPRDTFMVVNDSAADILRDHNRRFNNPTKATDLFRHSGVHGSEVMRAQLQEWLNIEIDYYITIDLDAFRNIVDIIGGVHFNVPRRMLYNNHHDIVIDIQPGYQLLDGHQAEGLVRYRAGYVRADMQRIEVQQDFMKALFSQVLQREILMDVNNIMALVETVLSYVDTDFPLANVAMYIPHLSSLNAENLRTQTMPGNPQGWHTTLGSIVEPSMGEFVPILNQVFHGIYLPEPEEETLAGLPLENTTLAERNAP